jgi:hypothetical protein
MILARERIESMKKSPYIGWLCTPTDWINVLETALHYMKWKEIAGRLYEPLRETRHDEWTLEARWAIEEYEEAKEDDWE